MSIQIRDSATGQVVKTVGSGTNYQEASKSSSSSSSSSRNESYTLNRRTGRYETSGSYIDKQGYERDKNTGQLTSKEQRNLRRAGYDQNRINTVSNTTPEDITTKDLATGKGNVPLTRQTYDKIMRQQSSQQMTQQLDKEPYVYIAQRKEIDQAKKEYAQYQEQEKMSGQEQYLEIPANKESFLFQKGGSIPKSIAQESFYLPQQAQNQYVGTVTKVVEPTSPFPKPKTFTGSKMDVVNPTIFPKEINKEQVFNRVVSSDSPDVVKAKIELADARQFSKDEPSFLATARKDVLKGKVVVEQLNLPYPVKRSLGYTLGFQAGIVETGLFVKQAGTTFVKGVKNIGTGKFVEGAKNIFIDIPKPLVIGTAEVLGSAVAKTEKFLTKPKEFLKEDLPSIINPVNAGFTEGKFSSTVILSSTVPSFSFNKFKDFLRTRGGKFVELADFNTKPFLKFESGFEREVFMRRYGGLKISEPRSWVEWFKGYKKGQFVKRQYNLVPAEVRGKYAGLKEVTFWEIQPDKSVKQVTKKTESFPYDEPVTHFDWATKKNFQKFYLPRTSELPSYVKADNMGAFGYSATGQEWGTNLINKYGEYVSHRGVSERFLRLGAGDSNAYSFSLFGLNKEISASSPIVYAEYLKGAKINKGFEIKVFEPNNPKPFKTYVFSGSVKEGFAEIPMYKREVESLVFGQKQKVRKETFIELGGRRVPFQEEIITPISKQAGNVQTIKPNENVVNNKLKRLYDKFINEKSVSSLPELPKSYLKINPKSYKSYYNPSSVSSAGYSILARSSSSSYKSFASSVLKASSFSPSSFSSVSRVSKGYSGSSFGGGSSGGDWFRSEGYGSSGGFEKPFVPKPPKIIPQDFGKEKPKIKSFKPKGFVMPKKYSPTLFSVVGNIRASKVGRKLVRASLSGLENRPIAG